MKKTLMLTLACTVCAIIFSGCRVINTNDAATAVNFDATAKVTPQVEVADKAVTGEATVNVLFGCIAWGASSFADDAFSSTSNNPLSLVASPNTLAKQAATYNACEANKADALLGAKYKIDTMDYFVFKTVKCTATGYPGVIKGVKAE
ncbi:MAG: hypothetical protein IJW31_09110 [Lentisphaeria bacterium]|nr:hypothetical protein [Lentisphaeria bacterium]MBR7127916.1 hypothetical protein [Lentisphaeria bacterium]